MPDISMCPGGDCPKKSTCYRHTAKPSSYQTYFFEAPHEADKPCNYYWEDDSIVLDKDVLKE